MDFPNIRTRTLDLREIQCRHRQDLYEIFSDEDVIRYYDLAPFHDPEHSDKLILLFRDRFTNGLGIRWGIFLKDSDTCIGTCGYNNWSIPMRSATIGYDLKKSYWKKGISSEAVTAILKFGFTGKTACNKLNRVQADTVPGNLASEKLLLKLGFREEGIRRQSGYWKERYHDLKCFGLIRSEFESIMSA